jgi:hypothetical protein
MPHRIIRTPADLDAYVATLRSLKLPLTVQHKQGADRSLDQNHLQFLWANEFAAAMGDRTGEETRLEWKLRHGVPILRAECDDFRKVYDENLKGLPYAAKLALMAFIPVTSLMTVKQMTTYLDAVQREALAQGVRLTDPEAA